MNTAKIEIGDDWIDIILECQKITVYKTHVVIEDRNACAVAHVHTSIRMVTVPKNVEVRKE